MTRIRLFDHPFSAKLPQEFEAASAGAWMVAHYGTQFTKPVQVFRGEPSLEAEITHNVQALLDEELEVCTVLETPGAEAIAYAASWVIANWATIATYIQYAAAAYSIYTALTASQGSMPGNVNRTSASPNNSLGSRDNQVRYLQRIEDIFGTVRSIPSLMMPTYNKYINNRRVEYGYYCVGRGYHTFDDVRDGETLISDIPGSSAAIYGPFTGPNSGDSPDVLIGDAIIDGIVTARRSIEVDGITLKAANQVQLVDSGGYTFTADVGGDIITQVEKTPNFNAVAEPGDEVTITGATTTITRGAGDGVLTIDAADDTVASDVSGAWAHLVVGDTVTTAGWTEAGNNGTATVLSFPDAFKVELSGSGRTNETYAPGTLSISRDYSGTREIASVGDGFAVLTDAVWDGSSGEDPITASVQLADKNHVTAWVTIPTPGRTEVWCNIVAAQGMFRDSGGKALTEVDFTVEIEELDPDDLTPTANVETVTGTISGQTSDERAQTVEHVTSWTGPCRVRMYRSSAYDFAFAGTIIDEIKWGDLYGVTPVDNKDDFGNLTTIHTVTLATVRATAARQRQLNCLASRLLPIWDGSAFSGAFAADGSLASGTIAATSRIVDILPAVVIDPLIGNRDIAELDMAQIWSVQQQLDALHAEAGEFNYTFDTDNFSLEDTIATIANAAFCDAYRQSGKIRLALDRQQDTSFTVFTHRNKAPGAETLSRSFANDSDYDGVEFVYRDPDTEQGETIRIPLDGSATKPKKFEMPGIQRFSQAWLRANREYRKILGRRLAIETSCTTDARALLKNMKVDIVDNTRFDSNDGEVVGQDGLVLRLSQRVTFLPSLPHSIVLLKRDGSYQSIACTAGADENHVVLASLPAEDIVTEHGPDGVQTIYSFAADSVRGAMAYLVTEIDPPKNNYVTLRAVNYSDEYYAMDTEPIPDSASVIN